MLFCYTFLALTPLLWKPNFVLYLMSTYLNPNSSSTQFQLNFDSTLFQPQINLSLNINLNSTSTLTSTLYGCDIKATQSCSVVFRFQRLHDQSCYCHSKPSTYGSATGLLKIFSSKRVAKVVKKEHNYMFHCQS